MNEHTDPKHFNHISDNPLLTHLIQAIAKFGEYQTQHKSDTEELYPIFISLFEAYKLAGGDMDKLNSILKDIDEIECPGEIHDADFLVYEESEKEGEDTSPDMEG